MSDDPRGALTVIGRIILAAQRLAALAQTGMAYAKDEYDIHRYREARAIAIELLALSGDQSFETIERQFAPEVGYVTPKVDVRGAAFRDERILLVRERSDGGWTLPGGWSDVGDSPSEAVEREIREESGFVTRAVKLLAVLDRNRHGHPPMPLHAYKLFFLCEILGGEAAPSSETDEVAFFAEDGIPDLSTPRVTREQIARLFEHRRHPDWPADFD
ncbi:MAG: NUDIX hydrolase N-terminal domain-containing protein [Vicinamibacteria bacterium]|nr:NUDIX hydrolase N-terminal domain-containing protein [Vicinamibacteria bacterium]